MLRRLLTAAVAVVALAAPAFAQQVWEIDPAHSSSGFAVRHMMVSTVRGSFGKTTGTVTYDGKDASTLKVDATIDATTINTGVEKRDGHLKSPDFFDVEKFATITFKSTKAEKAADGKLKVTGDLTMHGVTKSVTLDVEVTPEVKTPMGPRVGATATTTINRKDFGLGWNKVIEAGGVAVGEEVKITIDVECGMQKVADDKKPAK